MPSRPRETEIDDEVPPRVRDAAAAAFDQQERDVLVLDQVADTLIDPGLAETSGYKRRLRFEGDGVTAVVDVRGTTTPTLDVQVSPDEPAIMELRTVNDAGRVETQRRGRGLFTDVPSGLTSVLIRWDDAERRPARTAWVRV